MDLEVLRQVNVPAYDELSVKNIWPKIQKDAKVMKFSQINFRKADCRIESTFSTYSIQFVKNMCRS